MERQRIDYSEIQERGEAIYRECIQANLSRDAEGQFAVIDILSRDYEIAADDLMATRTLLARRPNAVLYGLRIGHPAAYRLGCLEQSRSL